MTQVLALLIPLLFTSHSSNATPCITIFKTPTITMLKPFLGPRVTLQAHELTKSGTIIHSLKESKAFAQSMRRRDGTYPVLITKNRTVIISHRLPNNQVSENSKFLATHRGLYSQLKKKIGDPQIVFAGHIRIIGGEPIRIIDQASTFYDTAKELGTKEQLISSNQQRLLAARDLLLELSLINKKTKTLNFFKNFNNLPTALQFDGHVRDKQVALFELQCRAMSGCWKILKKFEKVIRTIISKKGLSFLDKTLVNKKDNKDEDLLIISTLSSMLSDGVIDFMASSSYFSLSLKDVDQKSVEKFKYFLENFDKFKKDNLE